jgi:hypothetical protein
VLASCARVRQQVWRRAAAAAAATAARYSPRHATASAADDSAAAPRNADSLLGRLDLIQRKVVGGNTSIVLVLKAHDHGVQDAALQGGRGTGSSNISRYHPEAQEAQLVRY